MKKFIILTLLSVLLFIPITSTIFNQFPIIPILFGLDAIDCYEYESEDTYFHENEYPQKGRTLEQVELYFSDYKKKIGNENMLLYRTFKFPIFKYWRWDEYFNNKRWRYKYRQKLAPN